MIEIKVDASKAIARFSPRGIPDSVRKNLRAVLPDLGKRLGALAEDNLIGSVDSWTHIDIKREMIEDANRIVVSVRAEWTGDKSKALVPFWIEEGTRPHEIVASGLAGGSGPRALYFFWKKIGSYFLGPRVMNPGIDARHYMQRAFDAMEPEITPALEKAVTDGMNETAG